MKILIIGAAWVGDIVMSQSLLRALKKKNPDCVIDVLTPAFTVPLLERMPEVNKTWVMPVGHGKFDLKSRWRLGRSLKKEKYDHAIVLPNSWKSALIPFFAGISKRSGWVGESRYFLLNDIRRLDKKKLPLMVERFVVLSSSLRDAQRRSNLADGLPCHYVPRNDEFLPKLTASMNTPALAEKYNLSNKKILTLCPGAQFGSSKCWPAEYFAVVANQKLNEGWVVLLLGSKDDQKITGKIHQATQNRCLDLAGQTSLGDAIDILSLATVVVSNDSGLMHIAAALDRPLIALYGSTSPGFTPPLKKEAVILQINDLPCRPCFQRECPLGHHKCMRDLLPVMVLKSLEQLISD